MKKRTLNDDEVTTIVDLFSKGTAVKNISEDKHYTLSEIKARFGTLTRVYKSGLKKTV